MSEARSYSRDYAGYYGKGRDYRQAGAASDMLGAFSDWSRDGGYGCTPCCGGGGGYGGSSASFFSDGTLFALLAGAALAFYILYTTITMNAGTGKRRKRGARNGKGDWEEEDEGLFDGFEDIVWQGRSMFNSRVSCSNFKPSSFILLKSQ